jgi:hypothetical protein
MERNSYSYEITISLFGCTLFIRIANPLRREGEEYIFLSCGNKYTVRPRLVRGMTIPLGK